MKYKYSSPEIVVDELTKMDILCGSEDENDNQNFSKEINNEISRLIDFVFH